MTAARRPTLDDEIIPTLVALRRRFEAISRSELTRLEPKLSALSQEARTRLVELTQLIVEKLLLTPTEQLKSAGDETIRVRYTDVLNQLFRLAADDAVERGPLKGVRHEGSGHLRQPASKIRKSGAPGDGRRIDAAKSGTCPL